MDRLLQDLRMAIRRLQNNPGFALVAVLTLALGIGANTTVFSAINAILFRPLPVERPQELVFVERARKDFPTQSYPNYRDLRDRNQVLAGLIAYRFAPMSLSHDGQNARVWGYLATGNYFEVLGVQAVRGRTFTAADDLRPGGHPVAVLSHGCWQRRFGGDPEIAGQRVKINGLDFTILGVMPLGFHGPELLYAPEIWVPMVMQAQIEPGNAWLERRGTANIFVLGRLKPGLARRQAEDGLNAVATELAREYPANNEGMRLELTPPGLFGGMLRGPVIGFAAVLMGVACLVLLIACTNLASLLLARASDRRRETAIRLALGADRAQLVRQLLTESLLLAAAGGAAGLLLAVWLRDLFYAWQPPVDFPLTAPLDIDARVLLFTLLVSLGTSVLFGLAPALQATRTDLVPALKNDISTARLPRWQFRDLLVAVQVALSAMLLTGSVTAVRSLRRALEIPLGFNPQGAVSLSFDLALEGYDEPRGREFQRRLLERSAALPGVQSAGLINSLPLRLERSTNTIYVEGKPVPKASETAHAVYYVASPGYFRTVQTRLLAGREFDERDQPSSMRVAVVNRTFARKLVGTEEAVGRRFRFSPTGSWILQIVGVVEDGKYGWLSEEPTPAVFLCTYQSYNSTTTLVLRTALDADKVLTELRRVVQEMAPVMSLYDAQSLTDGLRLALFPARLAASMLSAFGLVALLLAVTGLYGVMAYAVARRTREIGIRLAVGAAGSQILALVMRRMALLVGLGTVAGGAAALGLGGWLAPVLYGVSPREPGTLVLAVVLLAVAGFAASWLPARRALSIDPVAALRQE